MDCAQIRHEFLSGGVPSGELVAEHARVCGECAELLRDRGWLGRRLAAAALSPTLASADDPSRLDPVLAEERGPRAYLRSRSTRVRWALCMTLATLLLAYELLRNVVEWNAARSLGALSLISALGWILWLALRPMPVNRSQARVQLLVAMCAWCAPGVLWFVPHRRVGALQLGHEFARESLICFGYGSACALPSFALLWALDRSPRVSYRVWAFAVGTLAVVANLILLAHCPLNERAHWVAGHFSIGLVWFGGVLVTALFADHRRR